MSVKQLKSKKYLGYEECFVSLQITCHMEGQILPMGYNMDYKACQSYCNNDLNCKFIYHFTSGHCLRYSFCNKTRIPTDSGKTYSKELNCPSKEIFIHSRNIEYKLYSFD